MGFDGEIILNKWNKKIKVNENGDYIELNIGDSTLLSRFIEMLNASKKIIEDLEALEITDDEQKVIEGSNANRKIARIFDGFFGANSCKKVFGVEYPLADDIINFLFLVRDYLEKFINEREEHNKQIKEKYLDKSKSRKKV